MRMRAAGTGFAATSRSMNCVCFNGVGAERNRGWLFAPPRRGWNHSEGQASHPDPLPTTRDNNMKRHVSIVLASAALLGMATTTAHAQQNPAPPVDPSFSAYSLAQQCAQKSDNAAQGQGMPSHFGIELRRFCIFG